jgi:hypothetical protein
MRITGTINYHGRTYEYEIDEINFLYIKDGTTFISVGQMRKLKQTENIEIIAHEMIKSYLQIKPIK